MASGPPSADDLLRAATAAGAVAARGAPAARADPTAPARLLALTDELADLARDARRDLDDLEHAVGAHAAAGRPAPPRRAAPADAHRAAARLVAVEMALSGAARDEVADVLRRAFGVADAALLDGLF